MHVYPADTQLHSSYNRLKYVFNEPAHSYQKTDKRVLAATGFNIKMLHDNDGRISVTQNGAYLERQFRTVLKRAHNPKRRYQAQTIIILLIHQNLTHQT